MLNELSGRINKTAHEHGWYDKPRSFGDVVVMCHAELSEAIDAYRKNEPMLRGERDDKNIINKGDKIEGVAVEMADCIIRILDWCGENAIDIDGIIELKMAYNEKRPYRYGNKKI